MNAGSDRYTDKYIYDGRGNILTYKHTYYENSVAIADEKTYTYDISNRIVSSTNGTDNFTYEYDDNGNMLSVSKNGEKKREYVYNRINNLMSSTVDGVTTTYAYNGDRLREAKTTNGVTTRHIYDGTDVVADVTGDTTTNFVRGIGLIYSENMNTGDKRQYALNAHGDVAKRINADGTAEKFNYRAYGIGIVGTPDPFGYCGEYTDSETGLIYLRNRYYDPELGRFINVDPIFSGANWYAYCSGNPVNRVDPFGLEYGKLRDFVNDYMVAFNGGVSIAQSSLNGKGFAGVTMGKYFRAFYYDGTIINREYDTYSGELTSENR